MCPKARDISRVGAKKIRETGEQAEQLDTFKPSFPQGENISSRSESVSVPQGVIDLTETERLKSSVKDMLSRYSGREVPEWHTFHGIVDKIPEVLGDLDTVMDNLNKVIPFLGCDVNPDALASCLVYLQSKLDLRDGDGVETLRTKYELWGLAYGRENMVDCSLENPLWFSKLMFDYSRFSRDDWNSVQPIARKWITPELSEDIIERLERMNGGEDPCATLLRGSLTRGFELDEVEEVLNVFEDSGLEGDTYLLPLFIQEAEEERKAGSRKVEGGDYGDWYTERP